MLCNIIDLMKNDSINIVHCGPLWSIAIYKDEGKLRASSETLNEIDTVFTKQVDRIF